VSACKRRGCGLAIGRRLQQIGETWRDLEDCRDVDATVIPASQVRRDAAPRPVFGALARPAGAGLNAR
jgi:hypothetical protein